MFTAAEAQLGDFDRVGNVRTSDSDDRIGLFFPAELL
jgi:hypothetical protein